MATGYSLRTPCIVAALLALTGCAGGPSVTGRPPEGYRRPYGVADKTGKDPLPSPEPKGLSVDVRDEVTGVHGTSFFHRRDCPRLAEAPATDRVPLVSAFDAIDAGFRPCPDCDPGP